MGYTAIEKVLAHLGENPVRAPATWCIRIPTW